MNTPPDNTPNDKPQQTLALENHILRSALAKSVEASLLIDLLTNHEETKRQHNGQAVVPGPQETGIVITDRNAEQFELIVAGVNIDSNQECRVMVTVSKLSLLIALLDTLKVHP